MYKVGQLVTLVAFDPDDTPPPNAGFTLWQTYEVLKSDNSTMPVLLKSEHTEWWFCDYCIKPIPTTAIRRP